MSATVATFGQSVVAAASLFLLVWIASVTKRDASLVDRFWGLSFVTIAWVGLARGPAPSAVALASVAAVSAWGLRLSAYLTLRNWGRGEDRRYGAMRERAGERFWLLSLVSVFSLQALLSAVISLPVQAALLDRGQLGALQIGGLALFAIGLVVETLADAQLARFTRDPRSRGAVMDRGLWRWSRHPNYFGEVLVWWGLGLVGAKGPHGLLALVGPALITFLLLRVSGVTMLERTIGERRPGYAEYARRTSAFVPWPRRA